MTEVIGFTRKYLVCANPNYNYLHKAWLSYYQENLRSCLFLGFTQKFVQSLYLNARPLFLPT